MLKIDVVTVRTLRGVYTEVEDKRADEAPGAAEEITVAAAPVDVARAWEETGEVVGCGTKTGSTRTLSRPT
jgi:hypothetical protein